MKCAECGVNNVIPTVSVDLPEFGPPEVGPMRECEGDYVFGVTMKPTGRTVRVEVPMDMVRKILLERYLDEVKRANKAGAKATEASILKTLERSK